MGGGWKERCRFETSLFGLGPVRSSGEFPGVHCGLPPAHAGPPPGDPKKADFNSDGFVDLAIGNPNDDVGSDDRAGSVNVIYGSADGLMAANDQIFMQDSAGHRR